jgi:polyhydroxyalkanoate synthase
MIPYPKEAFRQMFKEVVHANKLLKNELHFGEKRCDLRQIRCPLLAFAGRSDNIATPASTREIVELISSEDKTLVTVDGGHVGVIAGTQASSQVWKPAAEWLKLHSEEYRDAPATRASKPGSPMAGSVG